MQRYDSFVLDSSGKCVPNATVSVRVAASPAHSGALASIFSDNGATPRVNPFAADSYGNFFFFAAAGRYDIAITRPNGQPHFIEDIELVDAMSLRGCASGLAELDANGKIPLSRLGLVSGGDPLKYLNQTGQFTVPAGGGGGGGAPTDATYIVASVDPALSNEKLLGSEIIMRGALASRPVAAIPGRLYFVTDSGAQRWQRDTGTAWEECSVDWAEVGAKPSTFPPEAHGHSEAGLSLNFPTHSNANDPSAGEKSALAGTSGAPGAGNRFVTDADQRNVNARIPTSHAATHQPGGGDAMAVDASVATGSLRTLGPGAQQACAGNDARLSDARTPLAHTHVKASITDLAHTHPQGEVTNLVADLAAKQAALGFTPENIANKNAASGYAGLSAGSKLSAAQMSGVLASGDLTNDAALEKTANKGAANGYAPLNTSQRVPIANLASGTPDGTKFVRDDGALAVPSGGGGSDPWTYVRLASDFVTSSATAVDAGLAFTPAANQRYEIEGYFLLRTATATVGPRPGCAWPTGMSDGVADLWVTASASARGAQNGNIGAAILCPVGGLPNTTQSWPGGLKANMIAGASPSGSFRVQLASETAGTNVTMKAGSWIRYRTIP